MSTFFLITYVILWVLVFLLAVMVLATLRHMSQFIALADPMLRLGSEQSKLRRGELVPQVRVARLDSEPQLVPAKGKSATLILWLSENCQPCHRLLQDLGSDLLATSVTGWEVMFVVRGTARSAGLLRTAHALPSAQVFVDERSECARAWGIGGTPAAVTVDSEGRLMRVLAAVNAVTVRSVLGTAPAPANPPALLGREQEVT